MVEPEYWRLFSQISATMIGLVFVGTFYYLESGWKTFNFLQTQMEKLSMNYAKIIIAYFSTALFLSLTQEPFFPSWFATLAFAVFVPIVYYFTTSLNNELNTFYSYSHDDNIRYNIRVNQIGFVIVFFSPIIIYQLMFGVPRLSFSLLSLHESPIALTVALSLVFGYWNLIAFLLTPFHIHKLERDKKMNDNKDAARSGKEPPNEGWDDEQIEFATDRIKTDLSNSGFEKSSDLDIWDTYQTSKQLSGEIEKPQLMGDPKVDENGEATIAVFMPDNWNTDRELLDTACLLADLVGVTTWNAYRDLTGVKVLINRKALEPWSKSSSLENILMIRWQKLALNNLDSRKDDTEEILELASTYNLHPCLYPMGLTEYTYDPAEREPAPDEDYSYYNIDDKSHGAAKRYSSKLIFSKDISRSQIRDMLPSIIQEIREMDVYRNPQTQEQWKGQEADVIWVMMFDESREAPDMMSVDAKEHYLGKAEWFSPDLDDNFAPTEMKDPDEVIDCIRIEWSENSNSQ